MLNIATILDTALGRQHDTSSDLRTKALGWLNESIQLLYLERDWNFLKKKADLTITSNKGTLPTDYGRFLFCQATNWYLKRAHQLTEEEIYNLDDTMDNPYGWSADSDTIYFHPKADDETASLTYSRTIPTYTATADTIIPEAFLPLLSRSVINAVYEYEIDQRAMITIALEQVILTKLKIDDNRTRPIPKSGKYL